EQEASVVDWFAALLFVPPAIWACRGKIAGGDTDLPTSCACLVAVFMVLRGLAEEKQPGQGTEVRLLSLVIATLLFSLAFTFKVSCIVFAFLGWILAAAKLRELSRGSARGK